MPACRYQQLAFEGQCLFFNVPGAGSKCIAGGSVAVVAMTDNSLQGGGMPSGGVKYEVVLSVVACRDLPPGQRPSFKVSVGAAGS